jgi:phosphopantothenoylcysteine decarboxylase/phosphopantothenate--cysteine ligase
MSKEKILLGVTGGIAAYKAAELTSSLTQKGVEVTVVMTQAATSFITPLTFHTLSGNDVFTELFPEKTTAPSLHISLRDRGNILAIVPATANFIGKLANGIADDLLSTLSLSFTGPIILAPAMNEAMFRNKIVQTNLKNLKKLGIKIVPPEKGYLACGYTGEGRLANLDTITKVILETLKKISKR